MKVLVVSMVVFVTLAAVACFAGGEMVSRGGKPTSTWEPALSRGIPQSEIGPPAGSSGICRDWPLPAPSRRVGWGFGLHEKYGPTYSYPSTHNNYEGLNPGYYPFYHPRLWPNYKAPGSYEPGKYCGPSRSNWYWDEYDDWVRGARYEEHQ
jgi:hypothetical protein